jgi:death-on-curing family protein
MVEKKISKEFVEQNYLLVSNIHDSIIDNSGGEHGIRDKGGLYNSIYKILKYTDKNAHQPAAVGAYVYKEFARRHHFTDGNKRTAHTFAKIMLYLLSCHLKVEYEEATPFIIEIAKYQSKVSFSEIELWISNNLVVISESQIVNYLKSVVYEVKDGK